MKVKAMKWIDTKLELTKINVEWARIMAATQKYQFRPEFLWTKEELDEVIELFEQAYELGARENQIWLIIGNAEHYRIGMKTLDQLSSELWRLKQRRALAA